MLRRLSFLALHILQLLALPLPWTARRTVLILLGAKLSKSAFIGRSIIITRSLSVSDHGRIGHLNYVCGVDAVEVGTGASIGNLNWISGRMTAGSLSRCNGLVLEAGAAITNRHYIDCNGVIRLGRFSTFAGVRSQIFTHSIDLKSCAQTTRDVHVGAYSFIGTGVILLPGAVIPDYSIVVAGSTVQPGLHKEASPGIYGGVPAVLIKPLDVSRYAYFRRANARVD